MVRPPSTQMTTSTNPFHRNQKEKESHKTRLNEKKIIQILLTCSADWIAWNQTHTVVA